MAIIVEDGTLSTASANSYITLAEADTYCLEQGYTSWASLATADRESSILRAMIFIDSLPFKGYKTGFSNPLQFPRIGIYNDNPLYDAAYIDQLGTNIIPKSLKKGVCQAAYEESLSPGALLVNVSSNVKRKKIDVIETEYFDARSSVIIFSKIKALMVDILMEEGNRVAKVART